MRRGIGRLLALTLLIGVAGRANADTFNFTTAGATGRDGPTQAAVDAAYASTNLAGQVVVTGNGVQQWTVPVTGDYLVTAAGAQGAAGSSAPQNVGGQGALIQGTFTFTAGTVLQIAVGQMGLGQGLNNGGGGGGSFVVDSLNNPLVIAGGGGGTRENASQNGFDGQAGQFATEGTGSNSGGPLVIKSTGLGQGGDAPVLSWGSAGGGFNSDGTNDSSSGFFGPTTYGFGGKSWFDGLTGGSIGPNGGGNDGQGGFGGGGSGNGFFGGGGGGGYSGGDGGFVAGGGGSFNAGADQLGVSGANGGDGFVSLTLVPEPASLSALGFGLTCLGAYALRRRQQGA